MVRLLFSLNLNCQSKLAKTLPFWSTVAVFMTKPDPMTAESSGALKIVRLTTDVVVVPIAADDVSETRTSEDLLE